MNVMNVIIADSGDSPSGRTGKRKRELAAEMEVSDQEEAGRNPTPPAQPEAPVANGIPEEPQGERNCWHSRHTWLQQMWCNLLSAAVPEAEPTGSQGSQTHDSRFVQL
jgi:hypothetical protein